MSEHDFIREECECGRFEKNATSELIGRLVVVHGHPCADLRVFAVGSGGELVPTRQGICLARDKLGELATLVQDLIEAADEAASDNE